EVPWHGVYRALRDRGAYRVYFTAGSYPKVLAMEPVADAEVPDTVAEAARAAGLDPKDPAVRDDPRVAASVRMVLQASLCRAGGLTGADLAANRAGRLSASEQQKLRGSGCGCFIAAAFVAIVGGLTAASAMHDAPVVTIAIGGVAALLAGWMI